MTQRKKLNLKELELQLPAIETNETKIILGGNDYEDGIFHLINEDGDTIVYIVENSNGGPGGGNNVGGNNANGDDNNVDQGDLDHYYDYDYDDGGGDNAGDWDADDGGAVGEFHDGSYYIADFNNLPDTETQINQNACVQTVMEYLHEFFTGTDDTGPWETSVVDWYQNQFGTNPLLTGMSSDNIYATLDHFFNIDVYTTPILEDQIKNSLVEGHPFFASIGVDGNDNGFDINDPGDWAHAICIVGWNPEHNSFIYYDPADGSYKDTYTSPITYLGGYSISGLK